MIRLCISIILCMIAIQDIYAEKHKYQLAVCAIFRDEAPYLKEWIEFHRLVGVEHFYLYNNLSTDNYKDILKPYLKKKLVTLIDWSFAYEDSGRWSPIQCSAYDKTINEVRDKVRWLAILDIDEYLFPVEKSNLVEALKEYEPYGGVCVNWQMYGTSHIYKIPRDKLLIETLVMKAPVDHHENAQVKTILQPSKYSSCPSPHICYYKPGSYQVTENKKKFEGVFTPSVSISKLRINHYWSRDEEFFQRVKVPRRQSWDEGLEGQLRRLDMLNTSVDDGAIQRFVEPLRKKVFGRAL